MCGGFFYAKKHPEFIRVFEVKDIPKKTKLSNLAE